MEVIGDQAKLGSHSIQLKGGYPELTGKIELGIRPEFVTLKSTNEGIPAQITSVEDIGRFKIVHTKVEGHDLNVVLNEGESVPSEPKITIETSRINIYQNDHLVRPLDGSLSNGKGI